ncbi:uncharacterized protein LOC133150206 [Syngnathus typhle]|uniref:uncharacterized protein LOC133150206 n=1 Tax=Syngnathus typhle TaxID=161592 RepID=UPI002A6AB0C3|nr:uncharacterized protein LOC133150206 [Syngnathus typhle]
MSGILGNMDVFDSSVEDWTTYVERVEQYCLANEIQDERKVAVLLSVMGAKMYNLLRSLVAPAKPADKTFDEIMQIMKSHLNPAPLVIAERFRFHKRNQSRTVTVSEYIAELRKLAEHCQFRDGLSDALRDRFVCGLHNESIQKRLLTEDKLTLQRAVEIAVSAETAARDATELQANGEHFTKIDLAQAYLQMEMDESSRKYLTINTHKGLYQYNRLVFGITSAPAIWQRAMDQVLQGIPGTQCYLDDIIVTGWDKDSHLQNLNAVLTKLEEYGLKANKKKCEFFKESIEYCGHKIDKHGLHKTQDKIEAVVKSPQPENVSQLRSFLGLVNYYHKFLPNLSTVLHPLNALLHQNAKWAWNKDCERAFTKAKELIISDKVLTHFDPKLPLCLACDASPYGIGAVLSHKMTDGSERPIAFASRSSSPAERNYAQIDREALSFSVDTETDAIQLCKELKAMCAAGGFNLTKWSSNSRNVLVHIPECERAKGVKDLDLDLDDLPLERTLGVHWSAEDDVFKFHVALKEQPCTRRGILSTAELCMCR